jgi:fluoroacetyl-CoA thioesterase
MTDLPRTGTEHRMTFTVREEDTVSFPGLPPVLSTPAVIWHLETAAMQLLASFLPEGRITVGTAVEIEHTGPALVGDEIACTAKVVQGTGSLSESPPAPPAEITFHVEARRADRTIARGLHRRRAVAVAALREKLSPS